MNLVGGSAIETVASHDIMGRLMLMSARQPGLANAYASLLGFERAEFYMKAWPELTDLRFGELFERFPDAVPIGLFTSTGKTLLNPGRDHVVSHGDCLLVLADDNHSYRPEDAPGVDGGDPPHRDPFVQKQEKVLICGWCRDIRDMIYHLDATTAHGSQLHVMTDTAPLEKRDSVLQEEGLNLRSLRNLDIVQFV